MPKGNNTADQTHVLTPDIQAQIAALIQAIPRPRYSAAIEQMLMETGLITEQEVAELKGDEITTIQSHRRNGKMPPHYKWGHLICYAADDIANMILAGRKESAAYKRAQIAKGVAS